jgi:uncharacterized DUF497 family protein
MASVAAGFEWDAGNRDKCQRHGVSIDEIEAMFLRPVSVFPDVAHSKIESRFKAIGRGLSGRHIFLVFTFRHREGEIFIRPISARYMHRKEVEHYEKETARSAE